MGEKKVEPVPPPSVPATASSTPPVAPPAVVQAKPAGLVQDVEHAHPDVKMIEDEAHAHPDMKNTPPAPPTVIKTPPEDDKLPGPDDAVKEL
jgi:hypothetical protein